MLPEFIEVDDFFMEQVDNAIAESHQKQVSPFNDAPSRVLHEGDDFERDSSAAGSTWKHIQETVSLPHEDAEHLNLDELIAKFADVGTKIGRTAAAHYHDAVRKYAEKTGQLVRQETTEELAETLLRLFENADLDSDAEAYTVFVPPGQQNEFDKAMKKIDDTPHLRKRKKAIEDAAIERQRNRQANRKLVD